MNEVFGSSDPVERTRLFWICIVTLVIAVLLQLAPPLPLALVFGSCAAAFFCVRLPAGWHHRRSGVSAKNIHSIAGHPSEPATATRVATVKNGTGGKMVMPDKSVHYHFAEFNPYRARKDEAPCPPSTSRLPESVPTVTILIPAHNEAVVISETVRSCLQVDYPSFELIVVDDRSTDGTTETLHRLQRECTKTFKVHSRNASHRDTIAGKAGSLNEGVSIAKGEIIAIFDADARVQPGFLKQCVPFFEDSAVAAVQMRKVLINADQNWLTRCQQGEYCMDAHFQARRDEIVGCVELRGSGMLLRKSVIDEMRFNTNTLSEDLDLTTRLHAAGWDVRYSSTTTVEEEGLCKLAPLFLQRLRWSEGCIIRYLEHANFILAGAGIPYRTKLDLCMFVFEFIAPLWLLFENAMVAFKLLTGSLSGHPAMYCSAAMLVLTGYFLRGAFLGAKHFDPQSSLYGTILNAIRASFMVYVYFSVLWPAIVICLWWRILSNKQRNLRWIKTEKQGVVS